jgi:D-serine dehydratase
VLLANQVVDPSALRWVSRELQAFPDFHFTCLIDSIECAELMETVLASLPRGRPVDVLVELGLESGRTGSRTVDEAIRVATRIGRSERLNLVGVEGYEGILHYAGDDFTAVDGFLHRVRDLTERLDSQGAFDHLTEVLVTAGGSMFPDRVVEILGRDWNLNRPVRTIIRAGGYVTHDSILYAESGPFGVRAPMDQYPALIPALHLWSYVLSRPEPGLALAGFGKRDVSFDVDLPIPLYHRRGETTANLNGELEVFGLNDQHAYIRVPPDFDLAVGDIVGCGISHPCASFDRWRAMPLVDDDHNVRGVVRTFF